MNLTHAVSPMWRENPAASLQMLARASCSSIALARVAREPARAIRRRSTLVRTCESFSLDDPLDPLYITAESQLIGVNWRDGWHC